MAGSYVILAPEKTSGRCERSEDGSLEGVRTQRRTEPVEVSKRMIWEHKLFMQPVLRLRRAKGKGARLRSGRRSLSLGKKCDKKYFSFGFIGMRKKYS